MESTSDLQKVDLQATLVKDIFEWDVQSWSRAVPFWANDNLQVSEKRVLELGARGGGLSLLFALAGARVVCSDLGGPSATASALHRHYRVTDSIEYKDIDATSIAYDDNSFDIVTFKSVLGGIGRDGDNAARERALHEILRVLKPGGALLFAENLAGSRLHSFLRQKFVRWGNSWSYMSISEAPLTFADFANLQFCTWGFLAGFGRTNSQRSILSYLDRALVPLIPSSWRYIVFGKAYKQR